LLEHLKAHGHKALIIAPSGSVDEYLGFPVIHMPSFHLKRFGDVRVAMPLSQVIKQIFEFHPDVIHLASPALMGYYVAKKSDQYGIPTIGVFQTDLAGFAKHYGLGLSKKAIWKWVSRIHRNVDRTLAPSSSSCEDLKNLAVPNVHLWQRGVDTELFNPLKRNRDFRNKFPNKYIVGFVGRLANEKRVSDLVEISKRKDIQLVVVGDGPARPELELLMPNAYFTGMLKGESLAEKIASFDCFIHTGPNETFCQAVQESLSSGVPTIAVNQGGPKDLINHGKNGLLINTSNSMELHDAVNQVLHPTNWANFSENARKSVEHRSWKIIMEQLFKHYEDVIEARKFKVAA
jgi:phosphatidylinositol alpha 1,6-mannosyltransferase